MSVAVWRFWLEQQTKAKYFARSLINWRIINIYITDRHARYEKIESNPGNGQTRTIFCPIKRAEYLAVVTMGGGVEDPLHLNLCAHKISLIVDIHHHKMWHKTKWWQKTPKVISGFPLDQVTKEQFVVTHAIRQTDFTALLDIWVTNTPSVKMLWLQNFASSYVFLET